MHMSILELKTVKIALISFHRQRDRGEREGTFRKQEIVGPNQGYKELSFKKWYHDNSEKHSCLNVEADWQSKNPRESSE